MGLKSLWKKIKTQTDERPGTALGRLVQALSPSDQVDDIVGVVDSVAEAILKGGKTDDPKTQAVIITAVEKGGDELQDFVLLSFAHLLERHDSWFTESREDRFDDWVVAGVELVLDELRARYGL